MGFGFSFALAESLQFAGPHLLTSLLSFNAGVELGQLLVVAAWIPILNLTFRYVAPERTGTIILSVLVAHTAWHWMLDRAGVLSRYEFSWPDLVPASGIFPVLTAITLLAMLAWACALGLNAYRRRESNAAYRWRTAF